MRFARAHRWMLTLSLPCALLTGAAAAPVLPELAYVSIRTGDAHIWARDAEGREHQLTSAKSVHVQPNLAPDGRVTFVGRDAGRPVIMLMNGDGSGLRRLSDSAEATESHPVWSPDGKRIVYFSEQQGETVLRVVDLTSGRNLALGEHRGRKAPLSPVWSADGQRLLFLGADDKGRPQVFVIGADGSGLRDISGGHSPRGALGADLSADGRKVAWIASFGEFGTRLVVTDLETAETRELLDEPSVHYESPRWSPDGRWLAFASSRPESAALRSDIYLIKADGSGLRNLSHHPAEDFDVRWSPDGQHLVYASLRDGGSLLMRAELASGQVQQLTTHRSHDMEHSFRPRP